MKKLLGGLVVSMVGFSQTVKGNTEASPSSAESPTCDDDVREFVLTAGNPLFECNAGAELDQSQLAQCRKIVTCMIEQGVVIDEGTIAMFGNPAGSTNGSDPKKQDPK